MFCVFVYRVHQEQLTRVSKRIFCKELQDLDISAEMLRYAITEHLRSLLAELPLYVTLNGKFITYVEKAGVSIGHAVGFATVLLHMLSVSFLEYDVKHLAKVAVIFDRISDHISSLRTAFTPQFTTTVSIYTRRVSTISRELGQEASEEERSRMEDRIAVLDDRFTEDLPGAPDVVLERIIADIRAEVIATTPEGLLARPTAPTASTVPTAPTTPAAPITPSVPTALPKPIRPIGYTKSTKPAAPAVRRRGRPPLSVPGDSTESESGVESSKVFNTISGLCLIDL